MNISGQEEKSEKKNLKNSVRITLPNPIFLDKNCYTIGYERTIGDHQSFSVNNQSYTGDINADFKFRIASLGFQMVYQFVFWNRVSLDMILFGPGIAAYKIKTELSPTPDPEQAS